MLSTVISFFFDKYFTNWCGLLCWDFFKSTIEVIRIFIQGRLKIFPKAATIRYSLLIIAVIPHFSNLELHSITGYIQTDALISGIYSRRYISLSHIFMSIYLRIMNRRFKSALCVLGALGDFFMIWAADEIVSCRSCESCLKSVFY